jgi:hypothetical protein
MAMSPVFWPLRDALGRYFEKRHVISLAHVTCKQTKNWQSLLWPGNMRLTSRTDLNGVGNEKKPVIMLEERVKRLRGGIHTSMSLPAFNDLHEGTYFHLLCGLPLSSLVP